MSLFADPAPPRVVIIGAGFSGTLVALRILDLHDHDLELVIIERSPADRGGGLAFGVTGTGWEHLLNIQAGRISLFREEPDDFLAWANDPGTDKAAWPQAWQACRFTPSSPVPRRVFARYLGDRLRAVAARRPRSTVRQVHATVTDLAAEPGGVLVRYAARAAGAMRAQAAVLATGHWPPLIPPAFREVPDPAGRIVTDPYSGRGRRQLASLPADAGVLIVGTGLTSYDVILTLVQQGHRGPISTISRHGFEHRPYPLDHLHDIPALTGRIGFLDRPFASADEFLRAFLRDFARIRRRFADLPPMVRDERAWKALEPAVAEFCQTAPPGLVKELLGRFKSAMVTSRIGTVTQILQPIAELRERGALVKLTGEITGVAADTAGVTVTVGGPDGTSRAYRAGQVVLAAGRMTDLQAVPDQLWAALRRRGYAQPEPVTGLGVTASENGQLADGASAGRLFAVGPMRQGSELVRHGRTGAFVFSVGTLRNQAHHTALAVTQLLRRLRLGQVAASARAGPDLIAGWPPAVRLAAADPGVLRAVQLSVGYPMTRPPGWPSWDTGRASAELAARGAGADTAAALALPLLEYLDVLAVRSLTDISRLAPEIAERITQRRRIADSLILTGVKGHTPMKQITVELTRTGGTATRAQIRGHEILIDRPEASDGGDAGPMGGELLLTSIGGCYMSTLIAAARARKIRVDGASCTVTGTFAGDSPRRFAGIELTVSCPDCPPDELKRLVDVAEQGCVVLNTLRGGPALTVAAR
jgi:uncharacterized NAD(P)/FAD-binding protein YdhS/uncharacterized OsmC-like protein